MELNREQIIKALELWIKNFDGKLTNFKTLNEATLLINELTAKTEAQDITISELRQKLEKAEHDADRYARKINELTEENERLIEELAKSYNALDEQMNFYCSFTQSKIQNCPINDEIAKAKADTVRKMQERLKQAICDNTYPDFNKAGKPVNVWKATTGYDLIDQIAKEILEGNE